MHVDGEGCQLCLHRCPLSATMADGEPREADVFLHHKQGHRVPVSVRAQPLLDSKGTIVGAIELFSDASPLDDLRATIARLEVLALVDPLTEIPNRRYLASELASQLSMFQRSGVEFGIVMFDIDGFKRFNDEYGHAVGDLALQTVARTMSATMRAHDTVGRWGGEEFLVVLPRTDPSRAGGAGAAPVPDGPSLAGARGPDVAVTDRLRRSDDGAGRRHVGQPGRPRGRVDVRGQARRWGPHRDLTLFLIHVNS